MTLSLAEWAKYRDLLSKLSQTAADEFRNAIWDANGKFDGVGLGNIPREDVIEYAYALVTKYGEGSAELACQMYDAMAEVSGMHLAPAVPAETASLGEVGRAINGTINVSQVPDYVASTVGRLVKQASQDTTLQNALRDGAQFAWIPSGDTCPFCIMLASRGWQYVSKKALKKGHAEHIHSNCNCAYSVRFNDKTNVAGYDPDKYLAMYENAEGDTWQEKLNSMRNEQLQSPEARTRRNAQRRAAYAYRNTFHMQRDESQAWDAEPIQNSKEDIERLEIFAKGKGIILDNSFSSFDGDIGLVQDFIDGLRENLSLVNPVRKKSVRLSVSYSMDKMDYAITNASTITINGYAYRSRELLEEDYKTRVGRHFFTQGSTYLDIATHESAHVIVYLEQLKTEGIRKEVFGTQAFRASDEILSRISEYALKDNNELIAESYVAYCNGSRDEIVLKILEYCGILK